MTVMFISSKEKPYPRIAAGTLWVSLGHVIPVEFLIPPEPSLYSVIFFLHWSLQSCCNLY